MFVLLVPQDLQEVFLYEVFFALFVINDVDMSGTMELDEFLETLDSLGKPDFDRDAAKRLMAEHDKDESGSIDANEFGTIMLNEFCRTEMPKGDLVDASTGKPWETPPSGHCVIQLSYQCDVPTLFDIGQDYGIDNIIKSIREAKTDDQREILFQNTTSSPYFFLSFDQAQLLFEEMQGLNRLPLDLMANILPQIVNEDQVCKFIETNLNDRGKLALRVKLGQLYNSYVGLHTGHYSIDMKQPDQRNGGRRLGAICVTEGKFCRQSGMMSTQKGNNSNFRNEKLGYTPVEVTGRWFASTTTTKVLRCDYVSTSRPRKGMPPMTESRLERLISQLQLDDIKRIWGVVSERQARYKEQQEAMSEAGDSVNSSNTTASAAPPRVSMFASKTQLMYMDANSSNASTPTLLRSRANTFTGLVMPLLDVNGNLDFSDIPELVVEGPLSNTGVKDYYYEYVDTCHHCHDIYPEERMRDVSRYLTPLYVQPLDDLTDTVQLNVLVCRPNYSATERPPTPDSMRLPPGPNKLVMSPIFPLAYRRLLEVRLVYLHRVLQQQQ